MAKMTIIEGNSNDKDNVRAYMVKGEKGYSAYDLYVQHGGTLTEEQWLDAFLNADNYYNKSETDTLLDEKANSSDVYTKSEVDDLVEDVYSTDEIKTNKVWVNGKPIYKKTIYINEMPSANPDYPDFVSSKTYQTGLTNVDKMLSMDGTYYSTSQQYPSATFPLNFVYIDGSESSYAILHHISTRVSQDSSTITIMCSKFFFTDQSREFKGYVTLEYTKTTD